MLVLGKDLERNDSKDFAIKVKLGILSSHPFEHSFCLNSISDVSPKF